MMDDGDGPGAATSAIHLSAERWPLVHIRFVGQVDGPVFERYLADLTRLLSVRQSTRVLLLDASRCDYVSADARKRQAAWIKAHEANIRALTAGVAFVLPSAWMRGVLSAILWLQPLPCSYAVVRDSAAGLSRCRAWLEPHGLELPEPTALRSPFSV